MKIIAHGSVTVFQRFVHHLKQQPLLRVHGFCLFPRDIEETRIKLTNVLIKEVAIFCIGLENG